MYFLNDENAGYIAIWVSSFCYISLYFSQSGGGGGGGGGDGTRKQLNFQASCVSLDVDNHVWYELVCVKTFYLLLKKEKKEKVPAEETSNRCQYCIPNTNRSKTTL